MNYYAEDCNITNPNTVNRGTSLVYLTLLRCTLCNIDPVEHINKLREDNLICDKVWDVIVNSDNPRDVSGKDKGWYLHALHFSIKMLNWDSTYSEAVSYIISP